MKKFLKILRNVILKALIVLGIVVVVVKEPIIFPSSTVKSNQKASIENLKETVMKLCQEYYPRSYEDIEQLNQISQHIHNVFSQNTNTVAFQNFEVEGRPYRNVTALWGAELNKPRIVIGAHYDSYSKLPAADDNASGVAVLLELARLLNNQSSKNYQIELVAYTLEEPPYFRTENMGSFIHAQAINKEKIDVRLAISLETLGYYTEEENTQEYPSPFLKWIYPTTGNFVVVAGNFSSIAVTRKLKAHLLTSDMDLAVRSINAPAAIPGIDFSDHLNYWKFDIPALMITDSAFYRNKFYHSLEDTPDILNFEKMAELTNGLYQSLLSIK